MRIPTLKAILICDQIIEDAITHKKTLVGIFEKLAAPSFPTMHGTLGVFFQITGAEGEYSFKIELADVESNETIGMTRLPGALIKSAATTNNFAIMFQGLRFNRPGLYEFRVWVGDTIIGQHILEVVQVNS